MTIKIDKEGNTYFDTPQEYHQWTQYRQQKNQPQAITTDQLWEAIQKQKQQPTTHNPQPKKTRKPKPQESNKPYTYAQDRYLLDVFKNTQKNPHNQRCQHGTWTAVAKYLNRTPAAIGNRVSKLNKLNPQQLQTLTARARMTPQAIHKLKPETKTNTIIKEIYRDPQ